VRGLLAACAFLFLFVVSNAAAQSPSTSSVVARSHRDVSSANSAARAAFDDGLTLLYAFAPEAARASFARAASADPAFALAWWGVAMSHGPNINTNYEPAEQRAGHEAMLKARALATNASPVERALIDAAYRRFSFSGSNDGDRSARTYRDAMEAAATTYARDDDVQTLAAEAEMDVDPPTGNADTIKHLQTVLARNTEHIGANHFLIHAFEDTPNASDAVPAARRLSALTFEPAAEHLAHMPAHAYMRAGLYHEAGVANERAIALVGAARAIDPNAPATYFDHDCDFGVKAFMMAGEYARARALTGPCAHNGHSLASTVDLRFHRWNELAADERGEVASGMLAVHQGNLPLAKTHLAALRKTQGGVAAVAAGVLNAAIARASGDPADEIRALEAAVAAQDALGYSEPPAFWYPVREALGGAYYRAGRFADAERTFRADLTHDARNPRAYFGLAETLEREQRPAAAAAMHAEFERAWQHADATLEINDL